MILGFALGVLAAGAAVVLAGTSAWLIARAAEQPPVLHLMVAIVAVRAAGICGSDVHGFTGESTRRIPPMVMGHEATGEVVEVGAEVSPEWLGRRVILQPFLWCGTCDTCRSGRINLCRNRHFLGATIGGAMAERLVMPVRNLVPLPGALSLVHGTLAEPLSVALHAVAQVGDRVHAFQQRAYKLQRPAASVAVRYDA